MNVGRDYIVEYRTGQFQQGSLVLRFDKEPSQAQLMRALIDHGLPAHALEDVSARPLETGRIWESAHRPVRASPTTPPPAAAEPAATSGSAARRSRRWVLLPALIGLLGLAVMQAEPASEMGRDAGGLFWGGDRVGYCSRQLDIARITGDDGVAAGLFADEPTAFALTPANAAFMIACLGGSLG